MGAFDSIKNALGLSRKKKNVTTHPQNIQNRRNQMDEIERTVVRKPDADDEKTTMIWTQKNHK